MGETVNELEKSRIQEIKQLHQEIGPKGVDIPKQYIS